MNKQQKYLVGVWEQLWEEDEVVKANYPPQKAHEAAHRRRFQEVTGWDYEKFQGMDDCICSFWPTGGISGREFIAHFQASEDAFVRILAPKEWEENPYGGPVE